MYDPDANVIWVDRALSEEEKFHVLMHEWAHMVEHQTSGLGEENRCDLLGLFYGKLIGARTLQDLLK